MEQREGIGTGEGVLALEYVRAAEALAAESAENPSGLTLAYALNPTNWQPNQQLPCLSEVECLIATRSAAANRRLRRHQEARRHAPVPQLAGYGQYLRRRIRKRFGATYYEGTVEYYNPREKLYRVNYDDGDSEDLSEAHYLC